jgi:hypothetical protein
VPAAYSYMERFRVWSLSKMKKTFAPDDPNKAIEIKHSNGNGKTHDHQL